MVQNPVFNGDAYPLAQFSNFGVRQEWLFEIKETKARMDFLHFISFTISNACNLRCKKKILIQQRIHGKDFIMIIRELILRFLKKNMKIYFHTG